MKYIKFFNEIDIYESGKWKVVKWTKERCQEEALKYNTRKQFKIGSSTAYTKSRLNGWLDDVCSHMTQLLNPKGYWTKERCQEEALKYDTRSEFQKQSGTAYNTSRQSGWLDEICSHMTTVQKPNNYWDKERCQEEALKYNSRNEFSKGSPSAYSIASSNRWLNDICIHMTYLGSREKRFIYLYTFPDNSVYIGLTYDHKKRNDSHFVKGRVFDYMKLTGLIPKYELLTPEPIPTDDAVKMEIRLIEEYRLKKEFNVLNISSGGGVGGIFIWNKEKCQEEALKYNNKGQFIKGSPSAYNSSRINGWLDEICSHMKELNKPNGYWTKERCQEEALKYDNKIEFIKGSSSAYVYAINNGWLDEVCSHMTELKKPNNYWTKERCQEEALKYNTRKQFQVGSNIAYAKSRLNGWLDDVCSHMRPIISPKGYWTKERCQEEANKYNTRKEFQVGSGGTYVYARKNGWLDEICSHMIELRKPNGYWTKERCQEEALKYNSKVEFKKNSLAYNNALKNGWINDICNHMRKK